MRTNGWNCIVYKSAQLFFFDFFGGSSAANIASSKTFFKPFYKQIKNNKNDLEERRVVNHTCVNALHSTYLTALSSRANLSPCSNDVGFWRDFCNFSIVFGSSRRSIWVPTSKNGVLAQWCDISGTHY